MEEINKWLSDPTDYNTGLALAEQHLRNRNIIKYLRRKQDQAKLIYELQKVAGVKLTTNAEPKPIVIAKSDKVEYNALPDQIKPYYDKAAQSYQSARKSHYAMKSAKSDEERKGHRNDMIGFVAESRHNWAILDEWKSTGKIPQPPQAESKTIAALASSLTRDMGKLPKLTDEKEIAEMKIAIAETVAELHRLGRKFAPKTLLKLTEYNIQIPNAETTDDREISEGDIR